MKEKSERFGLFYIENGFENQSCTIFDLPFEIKPNT